jgi:hypothetical protein
MTWGRGHRPLEDFKAAAVVKRATLPGVSGAPHVTADELSLVDRLGWFGWFWIVLDRFGPTLRRASHASRTVDSLQHIFHAHQHAVLQAFQPHQPSAQHRLRMKPRHYHLLTPTAMTDTNLIRPLPSALTPVPRLPSRNETLDAFLLQAVKDAPEAAVLIPVIMHTLARGLQRNGTGAQSDLDMLFDSILARHPRAALDGMGHMVSAYGALATSTRDSVEQLPLRSLDAAQPLTSAAVLQALRLVKPARRPVQVGASPQISERSGSFQLNGSFDFTQPIGPIIGKLPTVHWPSQAFRIPGNLPQFFDPVPTLLTVQVDGNYEQGITLTIVGRRFSTATHGTTFELTQVIGGQHELVGQFTADTLTMNSAVIKIPPKFGTPVPDTDPAVACELKAVRNAIANTIEGHATESNVLKFAVGHFMHAETPAQIAGPTIVGVDPGSLYNEQAVLLTVKNLGEARVIDPGMHQNKPVLDPSRKTYTESLGSLTAHLLRKDGQDDEPGGIGIACQLLKPSSADGLDDAQVKVQIPAWVVPADYDLHLTFFPGIAVMPIKYIGALSSDGGVASTEASLTVAPHHFVGRFTSLQLSAHSAYTANADPSSHNLDTFNVFTVLANGVAYVGQSTPNRIYLKKYGEPIDPQVFPATEGLTLKDANGNGIALYGPLVVSMAAYNWTPGSDNQSTLDAIKEGSAIAAEVAAGVAAVFGGPALAASAQKAKDYVAKGVGLILSLFHKTSAAKADLDVVGTTVIDYGEVISGSNDPSTYRTGQKTFSLGFLGAYDVQYEFTGEFSWKRDEL